MNFLHFDIIHIIPLLIFFGAILWPVFFRKQSSHVPSAESKNYSESKRASLIRIISLILSSVLLSLALLGPIAPWSNTTERDGIDLVWILDVSKSMDVRDISADWKNISRLERAKSVLERYVTTHSENRYGLVIFSGKARLISPLTSESNSILTFLASIDSSSMSEGGTNFKEALGTALDRFETTTADDSSQRALVLLSDGGDVEDALEPTATSALLLPKNTNLFTIGFGSEKGGPIPSRPDFFGNPTYKQYDGETVVSSLNVKNLRSLADAGKWSYLLGNEDQSDLADELRNISRHTIQWREASAENDIGRWFIFTGLFFFCIFLLLPSLHIKKHIWNPL